MSNSFELEGKCRQGKPYTIEFDVINGKQRLSLVYDRECIRFYVADLVMYRHTITDLIKGDKTNDKKIADLDARITTEIETLNKTLEAHTGKLIALFDKQVKEVKKDENH